MHSHYFAFHSFNLVKICNTTGVDRTPWLMQPEARLPAVCLARPKPDPSGVQ